MHLKAMQQLISTSCFAAMQSSVILQSSGFLFWLCLFLIIRSRFQFSFAQFCLKKLHKNSISKMGRRTTIEQRELVLKHFKNGHSRRKIAEMVSLSDSTVQSIIYRFVRENRTHDKGRNAPNKIFNQTDERFIVRKIKDNPRLSAPKIAIEVEAELGKSCHPETIRRVLRQHDFNGRVARKKPFISAKNIKSRLQFAKEHLSKDSDFWNTVIFADESKFNIFGSDGASYVWRKPNTELHNKNLKATVKHGGGNVMVWACMSAAGVGNLEFIESTMDKTRYLEILKGNLLESAEKLGIRDNFRFYQDNDPKHKSGIVQTWLVWNCPHVMQPPAQSPDMNVIENLWAILDTNVRKRQISNKEELKAALLEEWSKIAPEVTKKLVDSMPKRLKMVVDNKGGHTKY